MLSLHSKSDIQPASAVAFIVCVVRHVEIMLDLHPTTTLSRASPVESASLHDLVELHWHSICMSQAAQGSDLVRGITIVPSYCCASALMTWRSALADGSNAGRAGASKLGVC